MKKFYFDVQIEDDLYPAICVKASKFHTALHRLGECIEKQASMKHGDKHVVVKLTGVYTVLSKRRRNQQ